MSLARTVSPSVRFPRALLLLQTGWPAFQFLFATERALVCAGLLGLVLGAICAMAAAVSGPVVPPSGDLTKPLTFNAEVGIYLLTIAALSRWVQFTPGGRARWRWAIIILVLYSYGIETIQTFRGLDPRFGNDGLDSVLSMIFGVVSLSIIVHFGVFAHRFIRGRVLSCDPLILTSVRYAIAATILAFAAGIWMIVQEGRYTVDGGNVLWLHAAGFRGLQALPLVGWLVAHARLPGRSAALRVHTAGLSWLGVCLAVGWQSWMGRPMFEFALIPAAGAALLLVWAVTAWRSFRLWSRAVAAPRST